MEQEECQHSWVAGMMYVHDDDVEDCARARAAFGETVECECCDAIYEVKP